MGIRSVDEKSGAYNNNKKKSFLSSSIQKVINHKVEGIALENMPKGVLFGHLIAAPSGSLPLEILILKKKKKRSLKKKKKAK